MKYVNMTTMFRANFLGRVLRCVVLVSMFMTLPVSVYAGNTELKCKPICDKVCSASDKTTNDVSAVRVVDRFPVDSLGDRVQTVCLYGDCFELGKKMSIDEIPKNCDAVYLRGDFDISKVPVNNTWVKFMTMEYIPHRSSTYIENLARQFPCLKTLELDEVGGKELLYDAGDVLDLRVVASMKHLRLLSLYYFGRVSHTDSLIDSQAIDVLNFFVARELAKPSVGVCDKGCDEKECLCRRSLGSGGFTGAVRLETDAHFEDGVRTFALKNSSMHPAVLPAIPHCCQGIYLEGHFNFSNMPSSPRIVSLFWSCDNVSDFELASFDFSKLPNLKSLFLSLRSKEECSLAFDDVDVCHSLECVTISTSGNCVVRRIEHAFEDKRIWLFCCGISRERRRCQGASESNK